MPTRKVSPAAQTSPFRSGTASTAMLIAGALAAGAALLYSAPNSPFTSAATSAATKGMVPAVSKRLDLSPQLVLKAAGLTPNALAAVGATTDQVSGLVGAARTHLSRHGTALSDAMRGAKSARQQVSDLAALAQSGRATQEQLASLESARQTAAFAQNSVELGQAALITAATAGLSDVQKGALSNIRAARAAGVELPLAFLVTVRSEADQVAIRNALAESRIAARLGEPLSEASQLVLDAARQDPATQQAEADFANRAADNLAAWRSALQ